MTLLLALISHPTVYDLLLWWDHFHRFLIMPQILLTYFGGKYKILSHRARSSSVACNSSYTRNPLMETRYCRLTSKNFGRRVQSAIIKSGFMQTLKRCLIRSTGFTLESSSLKTFLRPGLSSRITYNLSSPFITFIAERSLKPPAIPYFPEYVQLNKTGLRLNSFSS